jgi:hypothetical protein
MSIIVSDQVLVMECSMLEGPCSNRVASGTKYLLAGS